MALDEFFYKLGHFSYVSFCQSFPLKQYCQDALATYIASRAYYNATVLAAKLTPDECKLAVKMDVHILQEYLYNNLTPCLHEEMAYHIQCAMAQLLQQINCLNDKPSLGWTIIFPDIRQGKRKTLEYLVNAVVPSTQIKFLRPMEDIIAQYSGVVIYPNIKRVYSGLLPPKCYKYLWEQLQTVSSVKLVSLDEIVPNGLDNHYPFFMPFLLNQQEVAISYGINSQLFRYLTQLTILNLPCLTTDDILREVSLHCFQIQFINSSFSRAVTKNGIEHLGICKHLKRVNFTGTNITADTHARIFLIVPSLEEGSSLHDGLVATLWMKCQEQHRNITNVKNIVVRPELALENIQKTMTLFPNVCRVDFQSDFEYNVLGHFRNLFDLRIHASILSAEYGGLLETIGNKLTALRIYGVDGSDKFLLQAMLLVKYFSNIIFLDISIFWGIPNVNFNESLSLSKHASEWAHNTPCFHRLEGLNYYSSEAETVHLEFLLNRSPNLQELTVGCDPGRQSLFFLSLTYQEYNFNNILQKNEEKPWKDSLRIVRLLSNIFSIATARRFLQQCSNLQEIGTVTFCSDIQDGCLQDFVKEMREKWPYVNLANADPIEKLNHKVFVDPFQYNMRRHYKEFYYFFNFH